ncbi:MAG: ECF transporter S component [Candidatus Bathyarchaeia archaeon]
MPSKTRLLALVASLSAANVAFRFALAWGPPNVKPIAFLVIVSGVVGGPLAGFAVGWLSMTLSDLVSPYGAGIWTLETSSCMAVVGLLAGLLWHRSRSFNRWKMAIGGFFLTMLFDIGTSVIDALLFSYPWLGAILALYVPFITGSISPYPFGLAHELTTAILLGAIGPSLIARIRKVY